MPGDSVLGRRHQPSRTSRDSEEESPHRLVEFLSAVSRCETSAAARHTAADLVAEEFDAEVAVVAVDGTPPVTVGLGDSCPAPEALLALRPGTGSVVLPDLGTCHTLTASWTEQIPGRLTIVRRDFPFVAADRSLLLGMARCMALALDMIAVLECERGRHQVLEVLLGIQRDISHRSALPAILRAVTDGAGSVLGGRPVSLLLDDALDPGRPIVAGADLGAEHRIRSARVHVNGAAAGALVVSVADSPDLGRQELELLATFAEHASLALTDAHTVEAMQEAFRDPLTGLPNRTLFLDRLTQALHGRQEPDAGTGVLFVDLDAFKAVNDTMGHAGGDELLVEVAARLRWCVRPVDTLARLGGDEFAVVLVQCSLEHASGVGGRIVQLMSRPFDVRGRELVIGASVGVAHTSDAHLGLEPAEWGPAMIDDADHAMYQVKRRGGGQVQTSLGDGLPRWDVDVEPNSAC